MGYNNNEEVLGYSDEKIGKFLLEYARRSVAEQRDVLLEAAGRILEKETTE